MKFHLDALVLAQREQDIDHLETLFAFGIVDRGDVEQHLELAIAVIAQEGQHLDQGGRPRAHDKFAERNFGGDHILRQRGGNITAKVVESFVHALIRIPVPGPELARDSSGTPDLALELHNSVQQCFRCGRTAGHVDVDRNNPVTPAHD